MDANSRNSFSNKITVMSFILAVMVIYQHAYNVTVYDLPKEVVILEGLFHSLTDLCVPTFFIISGFLFYCNYSFDKTWVKWKSRIFSLVIPYMIWNVLAYLYYVIISVLPVVGANVNTEIEPLTIYNLMSNAIFGAHNITWFIRYLIVFVLLAPAAWWVLKNKWTGITFIILLYITGISVNNVCLNWGVFFCFGGYIGIHLYEYIVCRKFMPVEVILSWLFVTAIAQVIHYDLIPANLNWLAKLICVVLYWICFDALRNVSDVKWWMRLSFFIYVTHSMILEAVEKIIWLIGGNTPLMAVIDYCMAPIITLFIIIALAAILKKAPHLWKVLAGGRG